MKGQLAEVLVESGKEAVLDLELQGSPGAGSRGQVLRHPGVPHPAQRTKRSQWRNAPFPSHLYDPVRLAAVFAGVVTITTYQRFGAIRGNSPNSLIWRLEGVDIVNPNHTPMPEPSATALSRTEAGSTFSAGRCWGLPILHRRLPPTTAMP